MGFVDGRGGRGGTCPTCNVALQACDVISQVLRLVLRVLQLHRGLLLCHLEPLALLRNDGVGAIELGLERCNERRLRGALRRESLGGALRLREFADIFIFKLCAARERGGSQCLGRLQRLGSPQLQQHSLLGAHERLEIGELLGWLDIDIRSRCGGRFRGGL